MTAVGRAPAAPTSCALPATPAVHPAPCACVRRVVRPFYERNARRPSAALQALQAVAAGATSAAAASGAIPLAAAQQQQQLEEAPSPGRLVVDAEYIFSVKGCCTLRVHSRLDGCDAQRAAALAAALVALRRREQGLNAAVQAISEQLPGALDSMVLDRVGRLRAAGRWDAAMAVLGPNELHELCGRVAPKACKEVEEALVARAVQLQSAQLDPPPAPGPPFQLPAALSGGGGGSASGGGSPRPEEFRLRQWYDLPLDLTAQPEWEGWVRRLRGALIAWQRQQQQQQQQGERQQQAAAASPAGPAQPAGTGSSAGGGAAAGASPAGAATAAGSTAQPSGPSGAAAPAAGVAPTGAAQGAGRGVVSATFSAVGVSPDGLAMRTELAIRVQPPEGRHLVGAVERSGFGGLAACGFDLGPALLALDTTPEPLLQHALEVAALGSVRLPLDSLAFACTLHQAGQQAGMVAGAAGAAGSAGDAAAGGNGGGGGGGSGGFLFEGGALDLFAVLATVSWMASGGEDGMSPPDSSAWVPADGRIRFQRRGADAARWRLPWGQRQPGAAEAGEASYRLQVWPQPGPAGGDHPLAQRAEQPAEVGLSQRQLDGLMDCLDGFMLQHPGYAGAPPLSPLAVPPTAAQQAAGWVRERLGGGT